MACRVVDFIIAEALCVSALAARLQQNAEEHKNLVRETWSKAYLIIVLETHILVTKGVTRGSAILNCHVWISTQIFQRVLVTQCSIIWSICRIIRPAADVSIRANEGRVRIS